MIFVEFYPEKQGRPAIRPTKDLETGLASVPPGSTSGIIVRSVYSTLEKSNDYTAAGYTAILVDASGGAVTITLPIASLNRGKFYYIKNIGNVGKVVISTTEKIDGEVNIDLNLQYQYIKVMCDATTWHIIGGVWVKLDKLVDDRLSEMIQLLQQIILKTGQSTLHLASMSDEPIDEEDVDGG